MWPLQGCRLVTVRYVLGFLYGENRPKSENWTTLTPHSSATVRRTEKLTDLGNSLALGIQRGTRKSRKSKISLQCIPWPVACSECRCLFDWVSISDFRGKWPLKWKFSKISFRIPRRDTDIRFVTKFGENRQLRSCRKVAWITIALRGTRPITHFAQNWLITPKIPWTLSPLDMSTYIYRIWSGSAVLCRTYSGKIDVSAQKVNTIGLL